MTQNWRQSMDYSPWVGSILGQFENPSFPVFNDLEEFYINSEILEGYSGRIRVKKMSFQMGKNDPEFV